ncbi:MAG: sulfotransferase [Woeseiaceae bacterium]|nr:sulfotransferase [Woeseiaceae bacterium]
MTWMDNALRKALVDIAARRYETAHADVIERIRANVNDPTPYYVLARIALEHRNFTKSGELFAKARSLEPDNALYVAGHAEWLVTVGRQMEALQAVDEAAPDEIEDAFTADTIGVVYSRTGFHERAIPFFTRAVELDSAPPNFYYNLGASLQFAGEFDKAESAYKATIERQPDSYRAFSALVSLSRQTPEKNYLEKLRRLFDEHEAEPDKALQIGHAIAKTLEDLDRHEESFDWLVRAKRRKRAEIGYMPGTDAKLFAAAAHTIDGPAAGGNETSDASPVFIVGLPRTGTTLVDRILSSHPDVTSAGELNTFAGLVKAEAGSSSNLVLDAETLRNAVDADLAGIGKRYIDETRRFARGASRFTDKMPLNFFYVWLIHRALPNARVVALRRDPMDSCLSNFRQLFATGYSYYNYSLDIDDTAAYYMGFDQLLAVWRRCMPPSRYLEVRYEDIVYDQKNQTRRLLSFCDLSWNDACLRFHENAAPVATASSVQVRQPLYSGSIGRWRKYGDRLDSLGRRLDKKNT